MSSPAPAARDDSRSGRGWLDTSRWALRAAFRTSPRVFLAMVVLTAAGGVLPAVGAWIGKLIVDHVVLALASGDAAWRDERDVLIRLVTLEALTILGVLGAQRGLATAQSLLKSSLGQHVSEQILAKATTLDLSQLETPEVHDRLMRARRESGTRPLSLVVGHFQTARNFLTLATCIAVLAELSWWAVGIVVAAGLPAFVAELWFSQQAFEQLRKRSPAHRELAYYETLLSREDFAKEVRLYDLAPTFFERFRALGRKLEDEARVVTLRRGLWGFFLAALSTAAFYVAYAWIVRRTVNEHLSIGQMTMYLALFRQAQTGVTAGLSTLGLMLDDRLYLDDLRAFLALPVRTPPGDATEGVDPSAGIVFEDVTFRYPDAREDALRGVSFRIPAGTMVALVGHNGCGKTTLIKLLTRLYEPQGGRILVDGTDVRAWRPDALRKRFSVILQDFVRFKLPVGENVGVGDVARLRDEDGWRRAAERGLAHELITALPDGYHTQLGKWFRGGQELSGGQWQKVALARAFMRESSAYLVLDEPTASLDPEAEATVFEHVRGETPERTVLVISHRYGSVRVADHIVVLAEGRVLEQGTHEALLAAEGHYARLFRLQAAGYVAGATNVHPRREDDEG
ncbi:MAG: ABC transporter ATP-binding protein [Sandaracinaceae bacterium]